MGGTKKFINNTNCDLEVALTVRAGSDPVCSLECVPFSLKKNETRTISYGNEHSPFLNAIVARSSCNGQVTATKLGVTVRGSDVDNLLNTNNTITFTNVQQSIVIAGSNT